MTKIRDAILDREPGLEPLVRHIEEKNRKPITKLSKLYVLLLHGHSIRFEEPDKLYVDERRASWDSLNRGEIIPFGRPGTSGELGSRIYVLVVDIATGIGFALDRAYTLINPRMDMDLVMQKLTGEIPVDHWDGWLPTAYSQMPGWASSKPRDSFTAYWFSSGEK